MLIGISGKIGSGKTTTANALCDALEGHRVIVVNFADSLKSMVATHLGIPLGKMYNSKNEMIPELNLTIGQTLQVWGTKCREIHPDIFLFPIQKYVKDHDFVIVGDVRLPNEVDFIKRQGGFVVRLTSTRPCTDDSRPKNHESETALDGYQFDLLVDTDTLSPAEIVAIVLEKIK